MFQTARTLRLQRSNMIQSVVSAHYSGMLINPRAHAHGGYICLFVCLCVRTQADAV